MKQLNSNLHKAKSAKNDEFYTQLSDIERELGEYRKHFKNKVVYCNCDDPEWSNFFKFFAQQFDILGLKKLISTSFNAKGKGNKLVLERDENGDGRIDLDDVKTSKLKGNGDFRSDECLELLQEADIVVTNPPFSLFREFVELLVENKKKFLIIGSMNAITYKEVFKHIKNDKLWLGINMVKEFKTPEGEIKKFGNINWFTNLSHKKRNGELELYKKYNKKEYPKYDNYDVIEVSKVCEIPMDFEGVMGVPITFLGKYNPEQFEILGMANSARWIVHECLTIIDGRKIYNRILIKRR